MIKTAIKTGWRAVTGWFSAMQDLSYSKASNEVGHLPTPDGIGGTWKTFSVVPAPSKVLSFGGWEHNVLLNIICPPFDTLTISSVLKSSVLLIYPVWTSVANSVTFSVNLSANTYIIPNRHAAIAHFDADGNIIDFTAFPLSGASTVNYSGKVLVGEQIANPDGITSAIGGVGGTGGVSDDGAWWHISGRGFFFKYLVSTVEYFFRLYRSTTGWYMDGLASIKSITSKSDQLVDTSVQMDTMTISTYNQTNYEIERGNVNCPFIAVSSYTSSGSTGGVTTFELNKVMPLGTVVTVYVSAGAVASVDVTSGAITKTILIGYGAKFESCGNGTWFPIS